MVTRIFSLFDRYGFVRLPDPGMCGLVEDVDNVHAVPRNGRDPVPVDAETIERIKRAQANGVFAERRGHISRLSVGDTVRVESGSMAEIMGIVEAVRETGRPSC